LTHTIVKHDTVRKNETSVGRGTRRTSPESSVEPVKMARTVASSVGVNKKKRVCCQEDEESIKRNVVVSLPR
jgi:hypothetical protein